MYLKLAGEFAQSDEHIAFGLQPLNNGGQGIDRGLAHRRDRGRFGDRAMSPNRLRTAEERLQRLLVMP